MKPEIVLASGNRGKLREFSAMLEQSALRIRAQSEFDTPEAVEDGLSFVENAIIKARNAARHCGLPALADDSGIAVDALGGAPGIYSARYAGNTASDAENLEKLLTDTAHLKPDERQCSFVCVIAFLRHAGDPVPIICEGIWHGSLLNEARGEYGFGYDPCFWLAEQNCTSAELDPAIKNKISHRAIALRQLVATQKVQGVLLSKGD